MNPLFYYKISKGKQYLYSLLLILFVCVVSFLLSPLFDYKVVALILLVTVSALAISFDILPVLLSAVLTALIWNFFFIPPKFTFHISDTEDTVLFIMYFLIASVNAVLTFKIKEFERIARRKQARENTLKLYNTLLNSLSHELRTPIATIIGAADTLQMQNDRLTPFDRGELLFEISKASMRLNRQVENLLSMSRLESGFLTPKKDWCDLNEIVYDVMKMADENKYSQNININVNPDLPLICSDKGMLQNILYNLVSNAIMYTEPNSTIQIMATCHADMAKIIVEDDGPGFPEEEINKVFDKFYRLKRSQAGGTGLGLSIVKGFTEALNGKVQLENIVSGGSRFVVTIKTDVNYLNKKREPWLIRKY